MWWRKWLARLQVVDGLYTAANWATSIVFWFTGLTGAAVIAWASSTWAWYWQTFHWAGIGFVFLIALLVFSVCSYLVAAAAERWRKPAAVTESAANQPIDDDKIGHATVATQLPALQTSLYVGDIRFTFGDLKRDRHTEVSIRVFNGSGRVIELFGVSGQIKFNAPNNNDPARMGKLPPPALRADTTTAVVQLGEWLLILTQRVPATEADKLVAMLDDDIQIMFDLSDLSIGVFAKDEPANIQKLPLWHGVSYSKGHGFGRIIAASANIKMG
jgi:hypothetical protein